MKLAKIFLLILAASSLATLLMGDTPFTTLCTQIQDRLHGNSNRWSPLLDERIPRLIVLIATGSSLAVSGAIMQALFQNPLASPTVLGISSGSTLFATLLFILGFHNQNPYLIPLAAFIGALLTLVLVWNLAKRIGPLGSGSLILTGIAFSTLLLAIQGTLWYAMRNQWQIILTITEWEAASTLDRTWSHVHMQLPLAIVGLLIAYSHRKELDLIALGDEEAKNLGIDASRIRWRLFLAVALLTSGSIAAIGMIGFFGLLLPHLIRRMEGPLNERLIPLSIIGGASLLAFLDVLLRALAIDALSIGNVSAILGALFFLVLLFRREPLHA